MATNTVSFGGPSAIIAPDVAAEQLALQRRQQIVDLLKQQALSPIEQQTVTGSGPARVVPNSPLLGVSKMLTAYLAGKSQDDVDAKGLDLNREMAKRYAQILGGSDSMDPRAPQPAIPASPGGELGSGTFGIPAGGQQAVQPQGGQGGQSAFNMANLLRGSVIGQVGGDPAASAFYDQFKLPESVKANNYYGLQPGEVQEAMRRKNAAEGQTMVREGSTLTRTNPDGSIVPMFTAPDLKQGANITWQGGQPQAAPIAGLQQINASMAGAQTRAQEEAKAGQDMVTVNTPQGPRMMTRAQAVAMSGGGQPQAQPAPAAAPPQGPDRDTTAIYQGEYKDAQRRLAAATTDKDRQMAQADIDGLQKEAKRYGIPLQTEGGSAFEKTAGGNQADLLFSGQKNAAVAANDILSIREARKTLNAGAFMGPGADLKLSLTKFINANVPYVKVAPEQAGNTDYLKSLLGTGLLEQAKTLGSNPSNADASRINDIVGNIGKDPNAMRAVLDWREKMAQRAIQLHNDRVKQATSRGFQPQFDLDVKEPELPAAAAPAGPTGFRILKVN